MKKDKKIKLQSPGKTVSKSGHFRLSYAAKLELLLTLYYRGEISLPVVKNLAADIDKPSLN